MNLNICILSGNLTRDAELRYTPSGTPMLSFALAVNEKWKDSVTGMTKEKAVFIDAVQFGKMGEMLHKYLTKGKSVLVEGKLNQDSWEDKTTHQRRTKITITVSRVHLNGNPGPRAESTSTSSGPPPPPPPPGSPARTAPEGYEPDTDDVPY